MPRQRVENRSHHPARRAGAAATTSVGTFLALGLGPLAIAPARADFDDLFSFDQFIADIDAADPGPAPDTLDLSLVGTDIY
ncbi:hypothetical protein GWR20_19100, partial [Mycolicibacter kumamotonensis]